MFKTILATCVLVVPSLSWALAPDLDVLQAQTPQRFPLVVDRVMPCSPLFLMPHVPWPGDLVDGVRVFSRSGVLHGVQLPAQVHRVQATPSFDLAGNLVFGQLNQGTLFVMTRGGHLLRTISGGGLNGPTGTAIAPDGSIAVGSYFTDSVKFFHADGTYLGNLRHAGTEDPMCVAYDRAGNLFVGSRNNGNGRVSVFDDQLQFVRYIGQGLMTPHPLDLAFSSEEILFVTTPGTILEFDHDGNHFDSWTHPGLDPQGMAFDDEGRLFVSNADAHEIFVFDAMGNVVDRFPVDVGPNPPADLQLWGIAFDVLPETDCDSNGTPDACEIEGGSPDCHANGIPDECELGGNDCNSNGLPDDCEGDEDCNTNSLLDECDIAAGTSADCNTNGVPDECELISDACPVQHGDVNNDGDVDGHDVIHFILVFLGLDQCECSVLAADIDGDGDVDRADNWAFVRLVRCHLGLPGGHATAAGDLTELADELGVELDLHVLLQGWPQPTRNQELGIQDIRTR